VQKKESNITKKIQNNMEELEQIVQRMMDAGESEENIKAVILEYNKMGKAQGSTVDSTMSPSTMGSQLEVGLLEPQKELSDSEQFKNVFNNAGLSLQQAWESTKIAGAQFGSYLGISNESEVDNYVVEQYKKLDEISAKMSDTGKGIIKGIKEGDVADVGIGVANALTSVITTVAPAVLTRGASLIPQIMAPMYTEYNSEKAKALYGKDDERAIEKLIENNEGEVAVPMALGAASVALERIGIKGISKYVLNNARTKGAKRIADLTLTGNKEGLTEYFQGGLNVANKSLAQGDDAGTVSKKVFDHMSSEAAFEEYVQGFVGGAGVSAGSAKINSAFRDQNDNIIVNNYVNALGALNQQKVNSKTQEAKNAVDKKIKKVEQQFKNFLITNQKKSEYLTEEQATEAISILDGKNELNVKIKNINNQLKNGDINKNEYDLILEDVNSELEASDKKLNDIKIEANKKLLQDDLRISNEAISKIRGLSKPKVYKTAEGFLKALNARSKKQYTLDEIKNIDGTVIGKEILINEIVAAENNAITVGSHELLHAIVKSSITGEVRKIKDENGNIVETDLTTEGATLIKDFLNELSSKERKIVQKRIDDNYRYNKDKSEKAFEQYAEEYLNAYADAAIKNELNDGLLNKIGKFLQKIFNSGNNGYQDLNFKTGKDVKTFLKAYVSDRKKGQFREQFVEMAKEGVKQKTKTNIVKKSITEDTFDKINNLIPKDVKTKDDFDKFFIDPARNKELGKALAPGGLIDNIVKQKSIGDEYEKTIDGVRDRVMGYDPAAKRKTGDETPVTFAERIFADTRFARMDARKALATKKPTTTIDTKEAKELVEETASQQEELSITKARELKNFDVELEDGLVDAEIEAEVEALIEQNPPDLKERLGKLVKKDFRKKLDNAIGKIRKVEGKVEIDPEYEAFIRDEYNEIVNSFSIVQIRTTYKNLFDREKVGVEDVKKIDRETGKVTYFRKDKFINKINKPKFIKYFTQGGFTTIRERRNSLLTRIAERKTDIVIDNYIERNSKDINKVVQAKLRGLSRTEDNALNELKTFDTIKYSLTNEFNNIKKIVDTGKKYINPNFENSKPQTFADDGRIWEQAFANYFHKLGIPGLEVKSTRIGESGGMADFVFQILGDKENHEIKGGLDQVFMGSTLVNNFNIETGEFTLANEAQLGIEGLDNLMKNEVKSKLKQITDFVNEEINAYNESNNTNIKPVSNIVKGKKNYNFFPDEIYQKINKKFGNKELGVKIVKDTPSKKGPIRTNYSTKVDKDGLAVNSITILNTPQFGNATFNLDESSLLNMGKKPAPGLEADVQVRVSVGTSGHKTINGIKSRKLQVRIQLKIDKILNKKNEIVDITTLGGFMDATINAGISKPNLPTVKSLQKAKNIASTPLKYSISSRGMSTFDFDETLIIDGENFIIAKNPSTGEEVKISSGNWPLEGPRYTEQGYEFDFTDFVNVRGGVDGPLLQKMKNQIEKFGPKNVFVLTARPASSAKAIHEWLKTKNINIPFDNITGLGNSTGDAKAMWMLDKFAEGYNDMYFVDDALPNVEAVKNALEQLDIKSKVQQAKVKFSQSMNNDFNKILEDVTGIDAVKRFSDIKARKRGEKKGKFRFFIPPSHEDFVGLLYNFMGKGRKGDQHRDFFEQALVRPLNRAYREIDTAKQAIANDYKALNKQFEDIKKKLRKKTPDGDFIFEDAIRVYLWNKHGYDIPGLSPTDQQNLVEMVMNDNELRSYADAINIISKQDKYVDPGTGWEGGNIQTDLIDATGRVGRAEYFAEFNENANILFSTENLNKIEAAYGKDFRSALEDMLHRISTGINRPKGQTGTVNKFMNYLNGSVGTVMFFNVRSAILQQMSIVNYINFADNNMFAAAKAFANQQQYWADFAFIFNSDMLKQRRGGIGTDINGADLAQAVKGSKQPTKVVISRLLKLGFLPTQIGDNIAIATGGATFYRNRINKYIKDGLSKKEAETKAFTDFQDLTQSTQQSSRPDMTSQQQSSWIGKLVLNFQNITSQYNRIIKKAALDVYKRRISPPYTTQTQSDLGNLSKILYYGGIQNVIFYSLQTALFAVMFDDDNDEDQILKKRERVINGSIDSILRGAGIYGAVASTLKNTLIKFKEQREKGYNKDESAVPMELLNFSPVVGIKIRQIVNAEKTLNYNENVINEMETFEADNPMWSAVTNYTQALTNFPANRLYQKSINMRNALDKDYTNFQRVLFFSGYTTWSLGLGDTEAVIEAKEKIQINKKNTKKRKRSGLPKFN
jgi:hypothetical protein